MSLLDQLLRERLGMEPSRVGPGAVERALRKRLEGIPEELNRAEYLDLLQRSPDELQALVEELVVPETWFLRYPASFRYLTQVARERWLSAHAGEPLRVLCMACSTGEEPYSVAITLLEAGLAPNRFEVDAVDISQAAIAAARRGVYTGKAFRQDPDFLANYFDDAPQGRSVQRRVRRQVTFHRSSAVEFIPPSTYAAIFCRNLVIYLDNPTRERLWRQLHRSLEKDGLLFVGPSEAPQVTRDLFGPISSSRSYVLRKVGRPLTASPPPPVLAPPSPPKPKPRPQIAATPPPPAARPSTQPPPAPRDLLKEARELADRGQTGRALELCALDLKERGPNAEAHFFTGLLLDSAKQSEAAAAHYRKAIYLDPKHQPALLHLGLWAERHGDKRAAENYLRRAQSLENSQ